MNDDYLIYHNPDCGTSRNVLALMRHCGVQPRVIEYLKTPPSRDELRRLLADMGLGVRDILRERGTPYAELGLDQAHWSDGQLLDFIEANPILMNRPIVATPQGTRLCRPSEMVLDLLPEPPMRPFVKEDGELVLNAEGRRVR